MRPLPDAPALPDLVRALPDGLSLVLLDSAAPPGRHHVLALGTLAALRQARGRVTWGPPEAPRTLRAQGPAALDLALEALRALPVAGDPAPDAPGVDGLLGYAGYETLHDLVPEVPRPAVDPGVPDQWWMFPRAVLVQPVDGPVTAVVHGLGADPVAARADAEAAWPRLLALLERPVPAVEVPHAPSVDLGQAGLTPVTPPDAYLAQVAAIRDAIASGRVFEVCLTQRLDLAQRPDPVALHAHLRTSNPAPFAALVRAPGLALVSTSPETFLRADASGTVETRPIKGTRPRGATPAADAALAADLAGHAKDRAELAMIVDLARNDLGRVCRFGSVEVVHEGEVEAHPVTHQRVATVRGQLRAGTTVGTLLAATFPGGSMTGAPKIEAMRVIRELEPVPRGAYAGAMGWIGLDGALDLAMVIRTVVLGTEGASLHVGGAVVTESVPEEELAEAYAKAAGIARALAALQEAP